MEQYFQEGVFSVTRTLEDRSQLSVARLNKLKVVHLKELARGMDLGLSGDEKKAQMVESLRQALGLTASTESEEEDNSEFGRGQADYQLKLAELELRKLELEAEIKRQEREAETKRQEREAEMKRHERELKLETKRQEGEMRMREREQEQKAEYQLKLAELELRKMELEAKSAKEAREAQDTSENPCVKLPNTTKFLPKFTEDEVEAYFTNFERVAKTLKWDKALWTLILQKELLGKALEVVSSLSEEQVEDYEVVREAILGAYELVGEAYRQKFRNAKKGSDKTYMEFAKEKEKFFDRWCRAEQVEGNFEKLRQLILLEELKESVPSEIKTYLIDREVTTLSKAARLGDEYSLTHKKTFSYVGNAKATGRHAMSDGVRHKNGGDFQREHESSIELTKQFLGKKTFDQKQAMTCYHCLKPGHMRADCFLYKKQMRGSQKSVSVVVGQSLGQSEDDEANHEGPAVVALASCQQARDRQTARGHRPFISKGTIEAEGHTEEICILRDTGATQSVLRASVYPKGIGDTKETKQVIIQTIGQKSTFFPVPLRQVSLKSDLVSGQVLVGIMEALPDGVDLLLGNDLAGEKVNSCPVVSVTPCHDHTTETLNEEFPGIFPACAVTRAQFRAQTREIENSEDTDLALADTIFCQVDDCKSDKPKMGREALIRAQQNDASLDQIRKEVLTEAESQNEGECFYDNAGVLMRKWRPPTAAADEDWGIVEQVVLPTPYRGEVLHLAHDAPMSGHLGVKKTQERIRSQFFWPKLHKDVADYCKTCHTCQLAGKNQNAMRPAPLIPVPVFEEPFSKVIVDCVGPLPKTRSNCQYLLTIMDSTTRFPEAIPLRNIKAPTVVEALLQFFSRFGLPKEVQSDQGSNFLSGIFQGVLKELGIKQITSSAYHPESQGALERYHQTLKNMLRAYCLENPGDWDKGVPFLLFASRSVPNESTGFTPFQLVFGHEVRGPLKVLQESLLEGTGTGTTNLLDYVSDMKERVGKACEMASKNLKSAQSKMKAQYDKGTKTTDLCPGQKVLVLLPILGDALSAKFTGPYRVERKINSVNYIIATPDRKKKRMMCHVNRLKRYYDRESHSINAVMQLSQPKPGECSQEIGEESVREALDGGDCERLAKMEPVGPKLSNSEALNQLDQSLGHLSGQEKHEIQLLLQGHKELFGDKLGHTNIATHDVDVGNTVPIKSHPYRMNPNKRAQLRQEIKYMLENDIIEPSASAWSSPVLLVPKPDGTFRLCVDYRKVNAKTRTDSFPLPRIEDCIDQVGKAKYVSKIDLAKGYWQIPLTSRAREISAFTTPEGLFQCKRMPFGMKNAPASFQRVMNRVLAGLPGCVVYIDDVLVYSSSWSEHLEHLSGVLRALSQAQLVANLKKCEFGKSRVEYLGHVVGQGQVLPKTAKVQAIIDYPLPTNKKKLMKFLGMSGFYRRYCANYSTVAAPLTNLLKKNVTFDWSNECQVSFLSLKAMLSNHPVLIAPDFNLPFKLATDACDVGVGAVLLQDNEEGVKKPVGFFSKRLNCHQEKYSTIEKETLALVLAIQHFELYITSGGGETVVYTDHNPITFLEKFKSKSPRLFRWSLFLQPYPIKLVHIPGVLNVVADTLSRSFA